jgi:hypothetical protein
MLARGGVQSGPKFALVAGPGSYDDDSDVSCLGGGNGLGKAGLVGRPALAPLSIGNCALADRIDSVEWRNTAVVGSIYDIIAVYLDTGLVTVKVKGLCRRVARR